MKIQGDKGTLEINGAPSMASAIECDGIVDLLSLTRLILCGMFIREQLLNWFLF